VIMSDDPDPDPRVKYPMLWATQEAIWGVNDCGLRVADYVREQLGEGEGRDPAADMRGRYSTALEAYQMIHNQWGSMVRMAAYGFESVGLRRIGGGEAKWGDVGVIVVGEQQLIAMKGSGEDMWICPLAGHGSKALKVPHHRVLGAWDVMSRVVDKVGREAEVA
jgi:hypothetical protein